jgi:hypothetical protein
MPTEETPTDGGHCQYCGGEVLTGDGDGVTLLECSDCGNVVGLADGPEESETPEPVDTDTVTATDGELEQLLTLLRARGDDSVRAERFLLETAETTLEITAVDGDVVLREVEVP